MKPPRQGGLFEDGDGTSSVALVSVTASERPLSAAQRTFNRLTEAIRREREALADWQAYRGRFERRVAGELRALDDHLRDAQRRLVRRLDELLSAAGHGERLSRQHRARVRSHLLHVLDNLLQCGPDAELEALHDRHSDVSHAQRRRRDMEIAEALIGDVMGPEMVQGHEARDVDELLRHAGERFAAQAEDEARGATRGERARAERAAERKARTAHAASRSVREIYRRLASALHPDREVDAVERERKSRLMQRANQAYESDDLLELLALQIEIEQIEVDALASVPEERLRHYNEVLREQLRALQAQTQECVAVFRLEFELTAAVIAPRHVDQAIDARIAQMRAVSDEIERDLRQLDDPRRRRSLLDELPVAEADMPDLEELAALAALFRQAPRPGRPAASRRRKKGR